MIPHPLTLLMCWLIGAGLSEAVGLVLQFIGELFADAVHYGALSPGGFGLALMGLGLFAAFSGASFIGAAMRLWADKPWPKAAAWGILTIALIGALNSSVPLRMYPAAGLALLLSPLFWFPAICGCALGAYLTGRYERDPRVSAARDAVRGLMVWES